MPDEREAVHVIQENTRRVRIAVEGKLATIEPSCRQVLEPALCVTRRLYQTGGAHGFQGTLRHERFFATEQDGRGVIPAGLVERASALLRSKGYAVEVVDHAPRNARLAADPRDIDEMTDAERALVDVVTSHARGQIEVRRKLDRSVALALIARSFPAARVTITAARISEARAIHRQLSQRIPENVGLYVRGGHRAEDRLRVGTIQSLDPGLGDMVIVADVTQALGARAVDFLTAARGDKTFGFVPARAVLSRREALRIDALFGPVVAESGDEGRKTREVRVLIAEAPVMNWNGGNVDLSWKRAAIWNNTVRNRAIASLAVAFDRGDEERLDTLGKRFRVCRESSPRNSGERRVAVLVESPEHGRELARLLPDWQLLVGPARSIAPGARDRPGNSVDQPIARRPTLARTIMTLMYANSRSRIDVDLLIRADGTPWPLELIGFPPEESTNRTGPVCVVDFADDGGSELGAALTQRLRDYADRGWTIEGPSRMLGAVICIQCPKESGYGSRQTSGHRVRMHDADALSMSAKTREVH